MRFVEFAVCGQRCLRQQYFSQANVDGAVILPD
jgi:hypothetical protein